ncbi:hypothetical protein BEL04_18575 [Mucilaginibacter sp. PPCGB 2223]|uniref:toxin-antitoxin system YwqK family antitoxin n=1 Tax=Mucilaginibacter sp. PPCGB 2223 TaxID=1886027 RepID=UPI000824BDB4|nr:hypothetical protein [Mucilaginibacter sp. PPCGB 2223]OCX50742.1 hypothetical protein BEL04_18575 [Mucilaginibacter sp. PPCGB 2223]
MALLLFSCTKQRSNLKIAMNNAGFSQSGDVVLYHNQPFNGIAYTLYPTGDTARRAEYVNGKQDGWLKWWYPNKQPDQVRWFADGKKQGVHRGWWPGGQQKFEYHFTDDELDGELKEWGANGRMYRFFHYKMGHEEGSEKMWWEDGKVRANYVIINGEKFGLFGQKLCVNGLRKRS